MGPAPPEQRGGYQHWLASNLLEFTSDAYDLVMYYEEQKARKLPGYRVDAQTDAAIRYIDDHQDNPFFLFMSFLEPHHQNHRDDHPAPAGYARVIAGAGFRRIWPLWAGQRRGNWPVIAAWSNAWTKRLGE